MRFRHARNENEGLSMYNQSMMGIAGTGMTMIGGNGFDEARFKGLASALYAAAFPRFNLAQKAIVSINPSYVPDFLRDYMKMVQISRKPLTKETIYTFSDKFSQMGYDKKVADILFEEFWILYSKKNYMVPKEVYLPNEKSVDVSGSGTTDVTRKGISLWLVLGGIAVAGGAAFILMKKD